MKGMLEKVIENTWSEEYEDIQSCIIKECLSYRDLGNLLVDLLECGNCDWDDRAVALITELVGEYIDEYAPQPLS